MNIDSNAAALGRARGACYVAGMMKRGLVSVRAATAAGLLLALGAGVGLGGCARRGVSPGVSGNGSFAGPVFLDGETSDWPTDSGMLADEHYLYFRLRPPEPVTLQSADETFSLVVDLDGDPATGWPMRAMDDDPPGTEPLGVDLDIRFSPVQERPGRDGRARTVRHGTTVLVPRADGSVSEASHADIGLSFAPTFAAGEFEVRISRHLENVPGLVAGTLADGELRAVRSRILLLTQEERPSITGWSDLSSVNPPKRSEEPPRSGFAVPRRGDGEARIVSYNVLLARPMREPATFARIMRALDPDVVLVQEWEKATAEEIAAWFNEHASGSVAGGGSGVDPRPWRAITGAGWGVAVVSRDQLMSRLGPEALTRPPNAAGDSFRAGDDFVRFAGALVRTAAGPLAVASVHLKCCGRAGGPEDVTRALEARAINEAFGAAVAGVDVRGVIPIIAGDMNLVGSRPPLDVLRAGLDVGGESPVDLDVVDAFVLGDTSLYTWFDPASEFSAGRLDYALVGRSQARVARSFVLDTRRLSDASLRDAGLERDDSSGSDHLPLVVDVRRR